MFFPCMTRHAFGMGWPYAYCKRANGHTGDCIVADVHGRIWMVGKGGYAAHPPFRILRIKQWR
jgi:hypothetical protein